MLLGAGLRVSKELGETTLGLELGAGDEISGLGKALGLGLRAEKLEKFERFIFLFKS